MSACAWPAPLDGDRVVARKLVPRLAYDKERRESWRAELRDRLRTLVGFPERDGSMPNVRVLSEQEDELGSITKLVFTAEEHVDVPCYGCLPHGKVAPYTTFICLQGHTSRMHNFIGRSFEDEGRRIEVPGDRDFALSAMRHGFAALCIDSTNAVAPRPKDVTTAPCRTLLGERVSMSTEQSTTWNRAVTSPLGRVGVVGN